jgi:Cysteine-rich secretory protein family
MRIRRWTTALGMGAIVASAGCGLSHLSPGAPLAPWPAMPVDPPGFQVLQRGLVETALLLNQPMIRITTQVFRMINEQRTQHGLSPLVMDPNLIRAAGNHSIDMATNNFVEHVNLQGKGIGDRIRAQGVTDWTKAGENIFPLNPPDETVAQRAIDGWMASDGHRGHILNPLYKRTGIFGYKRPSDGMWYFTQVFID